MSADPFVVHVARLRRSSGAPVHEARRGEVAQAGPIDEAVDPGRSDSANAAAQAYARLEL